MLVLNIPPCILYIVDKYVGLNISYKTDVLFCIIIFSDNLLVLGVFVVFLKVKTLVKRFKENLRCNTQVINNN